LHLPLLKGEETYDIHQFSDISFEIRNFSGGFFVSSCDPCPADSLPLYLLGSVNAMIMYNGWEDLRKLQSYTSFELNGFLRQNSDYTPELPWIMRPDTPFPFLSLFLFSMLSLKWCSRE
jgi:hypothetical protein